MSNHRSPKYRKHPGRHTTGLVAPMVVSLTAMATGPVLVVAGPAFAQPLTSSAPFLVQHKTSLPGPFFAGVSTLGRHDASVRPLMEAFGKTGDPAISTTASRSSTVPTTGPGP